MWSFCTPPRQAPDAGPDTVILGLLYSFRPLCAHTRKPVWGCVDESRNNAMTRRAAATASGMEGEPPLDGLSRRRMGTRGFPPSPCIASRPSPPLHTHRQSPPLRTHLPPEPPSPCTPPDALFRTHACLETHLPAPLPPPPPCADSGYTIAVQRVAGSAPSKGQMVAVLISFVVLLPLPLSSRCVGVRVPRPHRDQAHVSQFK